MPRAAKKYRPYFTLEELKIIVRRMSCDSNAEVPIIRYLDDFIAGIEFGIRKASHETKGKLSVEESLGLDDDLNEKYRYENDLMSEEQEADYEKRMGIR